MLLVHPFSRVFTSQAFHQTPLVHIGRGNKVAPTSHLLAGKKQRRGGQGAEYIGKGGFSPGSPPPFSPGSGHEPGLKGVVPGSCPEPGLKHPFESGLMGCRARGR